MERKEFLSKSICACIGAGTIMSPVTNSGCPIAIDKSENEGTPCDEKHKFAQKYVKRLMDIFNNKLDENTRVDLVQTMGETCARGAYGDKEQASDKVSVFEFANRLKARIANNVIYWEYSGSPWTGLKIADGWCLCYLTEKGPEGLSGLWCECSVGYVRYMFERYTTSKVQVELLESLKRGGKGCKFKISIIDS